MLIILGTMAVGIVVGYILRNRKLSRLDSVMVCLVWLLLFLLGVAAGSDERIVRWIASLGMEALIISLGGVAGSSVLALLLWKFARRGAKEKGAVSER